MLVGIDWLSATIKNKDVDDILNDLVDLLSNSDFKISNFVCNNSSIQKNYNRSYDFLNLGIFAISWHTEFNRFHEDDKKNYGVNIRLTGKGCKYLSYHDFMQLLRYINNNDGIVRRIDIFCDLFEDTTYKKYIDTFIKEYNGIPSLSTPCHRNSIKLFGVRYNERKSTNVTFGNRQSCFFARFYDKAVEQKDLTKVWNRIEFELKETNAEGVTNMLLEGNSINLTFATLFQRYFRPIIIKNDKLVTRCVSKRYHIKFIEQLTDKKSNELSLKATFNE